MEIAERDMQCNLYRTVWSAVVSYVISLITLTLLENGQEIIEFPLQQWLRERATMLRNTYECIAYLVQIAAVSVQSCGGWTAMAV
jgi:hypothetical protein